MKEDEEMPLMLRRPFLATRKSLIDVHDGKLILRVGDEQLVFDMYRAVNSSNKKDEFLRIDAID